jgi:hypothetical protein
MEWKLAELDRERRNQFSHFQRYLSTVRVAISMRGVDFAGGFDRVPAFGKCSFAGKKLVVDEAK